MISIPLTTVVYDRGAGGAFTRQNPVSLAGRLTSYEDAIDARGGFKSLRVAFACSAAELKEWLDAGLMREMRSFTPRGRLRWEGVLVELKATIGPIVITRSLDDMANSFVVSYGADSGSRGSTGVYSNLTSIAEYGTKQLAHDLSTTTAAGAANWAQTELKKAAWPQRSRETNLNTGTGGSISIELRAIGRYDLLDWLLTSNTSTATAVTTAQAITLLTSYNATNNWFSTSSANVVASGHSDTQYIDPNTSYLEKLETLLSQGNSSQNAQAWGIYEDGTLYVNVWAGATPSAVSYYRDARDKTVRDGSGNIVEPWDVLPDAMVEDVALLGMAEDASAIATETREYVARVGLKISSSGIDLTMEPDTLGVTSPAALAEAVQNPAGKGATDRSARASKVARVIKKDTRTIHPSSDNPKTPVLTGGGSIDTGGGDIFYPPGSGSTTGVTGSGTTGALAKWTSSSALGDAVGGTDYATAGHTHAGAGTVSGTGTAGRITQWATGGANIEDSTLVKSGAGVLTLAASGSATLTIDSSTRLNGAGASSGQVLAWNGTAYAPTTLAASDVSAAPIGAKYIVQQADATLTNEQALGALATGLLKNTTSTGVLSIATASDLPNHASRHASGGADEVSLDGSQITTGTVAAARLGSGTANSTKYLRGDSTWQTLPGGTVGGTGTAGRLAQWDTGGADITNSTLVKSGAGVLTLSAAGAYTLTVPKTGTVPVGTGAASKILFWADANTLDFDNQFSYDPAGAFNVGVSMSITGGINVGGASGAASGEVRTGGAVKAGTTIETSSGDTWRLQTYTAGAPAATGYVTVVINGTTRKLLAA